MSSARTFVNFLVFVVAWSFAYLVVGMATVLVFHGLARGIDGHGTTILVFGPMILGGVVVFGLLESSIRRDYYKINTGWYEVPFTYLLVFGVTLPIWLNIVSIMLAALGFPEQAALYYNSRYESFTPFLKGAIGGLMVLVAFTYMVPFVKKLRLSRLEKELRHIQCMYSDINYHFWRVWEDFKNGKSAMPDSVFGSTEEILILSQERRLFQAWIKETEQKIFKLRPAD